MERRTSYRVFEFRNGMYERYRGQWQSLAQAMTSVKINGLLNDRANEIVETQIIVRPRPPSVRKQFKRNNFTHALAHLERSQPDTLFVAIIETDAYDRLCVTVEEEDAKECGIQQRIEATENIWKAEISIEDVPEAWKYKIRINKRGC